MLDNSSPAVSEAPVSAPAATSAPVSSDSNWLPEDLRGEASLSSFKDPGSLAKSYLHAQKMIGSSIRIPSSDASDEAKAEFYKKLESVPDVLRVSLEDDAGRASLYNRLGRPEKAEGYDLGLPETTPADLPLINGFREVAHKAGLSSSQAKELAGFMVSQGQQNAAQIDQMTAAFQEQVRNNFGPAFEPRIQAANVMLKHFSAQFPEAAQAIQSNPALSNNPILITALADLAKSSRESGNIQGINNIQFGMTADEARARIGEIRSNRAHPFHLSPGNPQREAAVAKMNELYQVAYADRGQTN